MLYVIIVGYITVATYFIVKFSLLASEDESLIWFIIFLKTNGVNFGIKTAILLLIAHPLVYYKKTYKNSKCFKLVYDNIIDARGVMLAFKVKT